MHLRAACAAAAEVEAAAVAEEVVVVAAVEVEAVGGLIAAAAAPHIVEVQRVPRAQLRNRGLRRRDHKLQDLRLQDQPQDRPRLPGHPAFNNHRGRPIRRPAINCAQDSLASDQAVRLKAGLRLERAPVKVAQASEFNLERDRARAVQEIGGKPVFARVKVEFVPGLDRARVAPVSAERLIVSTTTGVKTTGTITVINSIAGPTITTTADGVVTVDGAAGPGGARRPGAA
jgi:hypothetical protein